jgi:hypothetical protein
MKMVQFDIERAPVDSPGRSFADHPLSGEPERG